MKTIELITPCFNEEKCVLPFYEEVKRVFEKDLPDYKFYITYVDDGSRDGTMEAIKHVVELDGENKRIRYISLSRNFGKESAMYAGLSNCIGDYIVVLDSDLQHPPALIPQMLEAVEKEGYDCATARRTSRKGEGAVKSFLSKKFYGVFNKVTGVNLTPNATDFRLMKRDVAKAVCSLQERDRFTKGIYAWVGFKNKWIGYENVERVAGSSKWNIKGLARYSYHGFLAFGTSPLRGIIWMGLFIVLADLIWIIKILIDYLAFGKAAGNGTTTLLLVVLFLGGVIITILGMIGEYMARIYTELKHRPIYLSRESNIEELNSGSEEK